MEFWGEFWGQYGVLGDEFWGQYIELRRGPGTPMKSAPAECITETGGAADWPWEFHMLSPELSWTPSVFDD
ncbi:MAG: hypothetical protein BWK76_11330 [Desulfobulbaceae bacterium A2]|nr:MAG: hypothetical protein BWK76_11330 [Desulfobulbaceae bacterium A2]